MALDDIVTLTITLKSSAPTKAGFGRPLLVGYHNKFADLTRLYKNPDDMLTDGFTVNDYLYKMAVAVKSQNPSPKDFKIGKLAGTSVQTVTLAPTVTTEGYVYTWNIAGNAGSYTVLAAATVASIVTAITAIVNAYTQVNATDDTTHMTVVGATAGDTHQYTELSPAFTVKDTTTYATIATDLAAIFAFDSDWYGIALANDSEAIIGLAAAWVETKRRLLVYTTADTIAKTSDTTDVMSDLKTLSYFRTGGFYNQDVGSTLDVGLMAQRFAGAVPGSDTWAHKKVVGAVASSLTAAEEAFILGKNGNFYTTVAGNGNTYNGKVAGGDYFDIVRGIDHLYARIQEAVIALFQAQEKVPFTNKGIGGVQGTIQAVLDQHTRDPINFLTAEPPDAPVCTVPRAADVSISDKAARTLPDVAFSGKVTGAIHAVNIKGTLSI